MQPRGSVNLSQIMMLQGEAPSHLPRGRQEVPVPEAWPSVSSGSSRREWPHLGATDTCGPSRMCLVEEGFAALADGGRSLLGVRALCLSLTGSTRRLPGAPPSCCSNSSFVQADCHPALSVDPFTCGSWFESSAPPMLSEHPLSQGAPAA